MNSIIHLEDVVKTYIMGDVSFEALKGINLDINSGEFVSIIGPSGSGKSTLMHIIGLLDRPSSGNVFLEGNNASELTQDELAVLRNKHIGFVFQQFNLLARTSALDNVSLPLLYSGVPKVSRDEKAKKALERVGLGERLEHLSTQLSGGQQQRVAIARALINNPSLILADEPTGNLDSKSGKDILEFLKKLNSEGNTIVIVTHEMEIARSAKRTVEIRDGQIVSDKRNK